NREVGFIYALTNPAMPGFVKIGRSRRLAEDRAKELFKTGLPMPFDITCRALTSHPERTERRAHDLLNEYRTHPNREFFEVEPEQACDAIRHALLDSNGIEHWESDEPLILHAGDRLALT